MTSSLEFMNDIKKEIIQFWNDYDKDLEWELAIEDFKHYYGNHENSIYYYDFEIEPHNVMDCQRFVISSREDAGFVLTVNDMMSITYMIGLERQLLYWIMEDIDFYEI